MDPTNPPPDESERPARPQPDRNRSAPEEAGNQDPGSVADVPGLSPDDQGAEAEDSGAAEARAADDGWATEGESSATGTELSSDADLTAAAPSPSAGTDAWRGPEDTGWTPARIEPEPSNKPDPNIESASGGGGTSEWRGPEAAGRIPSAIEQAPSGESGGSDSAPSTEHGPSSGGTADWRGPETTGWTPEQTRLAPPEQHAAESTLEWPAADRGLPARPDVERSEDEGPADGEPTRTERVPAGFSFFNRARSDDHAADDTDDANDAADATSESARSRRLRVEERPRRLSGRRTVPEALVRADPADICPFLVAASGGWRLAVPSREHRCGAVSPPSPLSPQKQTRLCLTEGHLRCATFLAAGAARESRVGSAAMPDRVSRWALARTTPVVEEVGGVRTTLAGMLVDRRRWPAIPAMLLVVALATLGLSSLRGGGAVTALASPTPETTQVALATAAPEPTPTLAATPEPSPSVAPTEAPTTAPTPAPSHATYTVKSGDTLSAIAKQYGTTVQAIVDLNGIADAASLKIGQVLKIP